MLVRAARAPSSGLMPARAADEAVTRLRWCGASPMHDSRSLLEPVRSSIGCSRVREALGATAGAPVCEKQGQITAVDVTVSIQVGR